MMMDMCSDRRFSVARAVSAAAMSLAMPAAVLAETKGPSASTERVVTVAQAKRMCFTDTLQVTGALVAQKLILVRPEREGFQIAQIMVEPGDDVISGQVLARLSPPEGQPGGSVAVQAPAVGIVVSSSAVLGANASARAQPLFEIAERGELELLAETPVKTLLNIKTSQSAKVEIVGVSELQGSVRAFSTAIDPLTQLGQVRISVGADSRLRVGAFGRAVIELGRRCGPAIPLSAVLYGVAGSVAQVVRDDRVETRAVSVGLLSGGQAEIREGLSEGEMVIARAGSFVRDGDRIRSVAAPAPRSE